MFEYPKIETLFNRDEFFVVKENEFRLPEFENIKRWYVTEKIDGTNVRIIYEPEYVGTGGGHPGWFERVNFIGMKLNFFGRTDKADFHPSLTEYLKRTFTLENMALVFPTVEGEAPPKIVLYGEGYGPKIQDGGNYRKDISFRLFDVFVVDEKNPLGGWWMEPDNLQDIANKLGIKTAPILGWMDTKEAVTLVQLKTSSNVAVHEGGNPYYLKEGIVARTQPLMFTRRGERVMWKLKVRDFTKQKK